MNIELSGEVINSFWFERKTKFTFGLRDDIL